MDWVSDHIIILRESSLDEGPGANQDVLETFYT